MSPNSARILDFCCGEFAPPGGQISYIIGPKTSKTYSSEFVTLKTKTLQKTNDCTENQPWMLIQGIQGLNAFKPCIQGFV